MAKAKRIFTCQSCGHQTAKWLGKCPDCDAWNSYVEEAVVTPRKGRAVSNPQPATLPLPLTAVRRDEDERLRTDIGELDRVLGGGIVQGSLVLIGGDPGIGKSTLILQAVAGLSRSPQHHVVLYVSGEESAT